MSFRIKTRLAAILALLSVLLFAAAQADSAAYSPVDDTLTVSLTSCVSGNEYVLFLLKEGADCQSISTADILYMNQYSASGQAMEILHVAPDFDACEVAVAGEFADSTSSPRHLGAVNIAWNTLRLPSQLISIEDQAFTGSLFTHVYLGSRVTSIGSGAFSNCSNLVYILIPDSVTSIAGDAFTGSEHVVIHCSVGSAAHTFAIEHELAFKLILD